MPYCRECGELVEENWNSCPFCSQPIRSPASVMLDVQDSVVTGNINISNSGQESTQCNNCGAQGTVQLACIDCHKLCSCELCSDDYLYQLFLRYSNNYEGSHLTPVKDRRCDSCYLEYAKSKCNHTCINCNKSFAIPDEKFRVILSWMSINPPPNGLGLYSWLRDYTKESSLWVQSGEHCGSCGVITALKQRTIDALKLIEQGRLPTFYHNGKTHVAFHNSLHLQAFHRMTYRQLKEHFPKLSLELKIEVDEESLLTHFGDLELEILGKAPMPILQDLYKEVMTEDLKRFEELYSNKITYVYRGTVTSDYREGYLEKLRRQVDLI